MRNPNLNSLKMFDAAARRLNFRLAANELNLTQGAVAQQVRRLESDLGVTLFYRKARGLDLTDAGQRYHMAISRALGIIDTATNELRPDNERVVLSVTPSFASKWLVPRLGNFAREHPEIEIETVASEALADLHSGEIDVAIRQGEKPINSKLLYTLLAPVELCAVCSSDYANGMDAIDRFEDFVAHPLIQDSHNHWDVLLQEAGLKAAQAMIRFNQTALAMDAAAQGRGIALAPRILLEDALVSGQLVELWRDTRDEQNGFYIVYPELPKPGSAIQLVIEWVLSAADECVSRRSNRP